MILQAVDDASERTPHMRAAERIREQDEEVLLMFLTHMENYALRGYSVNALDFVLKPVNYLVLKKVLQRAVRLPGRRRQQDLVVTHPKGWCG